MNRVYSAFESQRRSIEDYNNEVKWVQSHSAQLANTRWLARDATRLTEASGARLVALEATKLTDSTARIVIGVEAEPRKHLALDTMLSHLTGSRCENVGDEPKPAPATVQFKFRGLTLEAVYASQGRVSDYGYDATRCTVLDLSYGNATTPWYETKIWINDTDTLKIKNFIMNTKQWVANLRTTSNLDLRFESFLLDDRINLNLGSESRFGETVGRAHLLQSPDENGGDELGSPVRMGSGPQTGPGSFGLKGEHPGELCDI